MFCVISQCAPTKFYNLDPSQYAPHGFRYLGVAPVSRFLSLWTQAPVRAPVIITLLFFKQGLPHQTQP